MSAILSVSVAYLIGSFPSGYLISRIMRGIDIREFGSGNIGATNVFRTCGGLPAFLTLLSDMFKGFLPVMIARILMPEHDVIHIITGFAVIAGHSWSIFMNFTGGKGVATSGGVFFALLPLPTFISLAVFGIVLASSRYVSLASISASATLPLATLVIGKSTTLVLFSFMICALIIYKHRANITRLRSGTENKFTLAKTLRKAKINPE